MAANWARSVREGLIPFGCDLLYCKGPGEGGQGRISETFSDSSVSFVEAIRESEIRDIFLFWCRRRRGDRVPARSSIDPAQIPHRLLPNMFIYARQTDGRFLCRLAGTALTRTYGMDNTGRYLDEILPSEAAPPRRALYDRVLDTGLPAYIQGLEITRRGEQRKSARLLMPLASRGRRADQILGLARFGPRENPVPDHIALRALVNPRRILFATIEDLGATSAAVPGREVRAAAD